MPAEFGQIIGISGGSTVSVVADVRTTAEDTVLTGNVLTNDSATDGTLQVLKFIIPGIELDPATEYQANTTATIPGRGTILINRDGTFTFTPIPDFNGAVAAVQILTSNGTQLALQTLTITVTAVNDGPTAADGYGLSEAGEDVEIDLLGFSSDPDDGATLTITHLNGVAVSVGSPVAITGGGFVYEGDGVVTVSPNNADVDPLTFTYTVSDGSLSDTGTIVVQVGVENTPLFSPISPVLGNVIDQAAVNFGLTYRGKYGPNDGNGTVTVPPYSAGQGYFLLTDREPWLYDRATTLYILAKRTGNAAILAEAMDLATTYMAGVQLASGRATFNIIGTTGGDPQDVKYLYAIVAWWYEREILAAGGTTQQAQVYRSRAEGLYRQTLISMEPEYDGGTAELWTERNVWAAGMNCLTWYWISGDEVALADAGRYVDMVLDLSEDSGAPLHSKDKHESDGDPTPIVSPWMSGLLAEFMLQYHRTTDDARVLDWFSAYGDWLVENAFYVATGSEEPELVGLGGLRIPPYLAGTGVQFPEGEAADMEHCPDVAELLRKCSWAKGELSEDHADLDEIVAELEEACETVFLYWTRGTVGYPHYRVNPPRKYGWWFRCRYSSVHSVGIVPFPPALNTAPVITGSTQQGETLTCGTGVWAGTPTPTYTYQWLRDGVNISGATANTYATVEADIDTEITCRVTATNDGGSASSVSGNSVLVVAAGSPEITDQPVGASALAGETAEFSAACEASPTATYQWQVSTDDGNSWSNVIEGTGGSGTGNTTTYTTEALDAADDGDAYRVVFTNAGGSVTSDAAALAMVIQQPAVRFAGAAAGATLSTDLGGATAGFLDFTVAGWFYLETTVNSAAWLQLEGIAGRAAYLQYSNSGVPGIGDSNTGTSGGSWDPDAPPLNEWVFMTFRGAAAHPGTFTATWQAEDGGTVFTATRANGIEDSVPVTAVLLNEGGTGNGIALRAQYVRGFDRRLTDQECADERTNNDASGAYFYCVFEDDGGGGVTVRDASGNNREFTLDTAVLSAGGPLAPTVP